jgi:hypothetical protein
MRCKDYSVRQILIGLDRIGIVGLFDALQAAETSGLEDREALVDVMLEVLRPRNYIPDEQVEHYRVALWRELLRHRGQDFRALYSEIPATVCGQPGPDRERFEEAAVAALAVFELRPAFSFDPPREEGPNPQLIIGGEVIAHGPQSRRSMENAVRRSLSDW